MDRFLTFIKEFKIPKIEELRGAIASFDKRKFSIFIAIVVVAFSSMVILLAKVNNSFMVAVPADGGTIVEGIVGMPTFVNPVLAVSNADKDLTSLVYSGLMRKLPDGTFTPDLAESYTISPDGMTYTFTLKRNTTFQDGTPMTADDVVFTIEKIKDPTIKSPRKIGWDGITIEKKDDATVIFTLKQPYISFMDNTTIGILPSHIWKNITETEFGLSPLNIKAIGSGPYKIGSVMKNSDGIPVRYNLMRFTKFALGTPHIKNLDITSYANERDLIRDLANHSIDQASGISPENSEKIKNAGYTIHTATLPRIFGVFFNAANNKIFADQTVVHAFDIALDRKEIVGQALGGYGAPIHSPIPLTIMSETSGTADDNAELEVAKSMLDKAGWAVGTDGVRVRGGAKTITRTKKVGKKTVTEKVTVAGGPTIRLAFSLSTGNTPELQESSELVKKQLESIGAQVDIKIYETGPLNQIIRDRSYEALFFGTIINHESDLFSFWHSSQKTDPGLNIALYSNKAADNILESVQKISDRASRLNKYKDFIKQFNNDLPALLIYSPKYLYATSPKLSHISFETITIPSDRFISVYTWYASEDHIWKIFTKSSAYGTK